jgi:hypothetical protein
MEARPSILVEQRLFKLFLQKTSWGRRAYTECTSLKKRTNLFVERSSTHEPRHAKKTKKPKIQVTEESEALASSVLGAQAPGSPFSLQSTSSTSDLSSEETRF